MQQLVQRLIADPHDADALAMAHQAGTQDPQGYASLLERVGTGSADEVFAAHWFNEAAMVWESLGDSAQCNRLLQLAADRDPANMMVVERVLQIHRQTGNYHALVHLLERLTEAVRGLLHEQPELKPQLMAAHEELAGIYTDGAYANPERAARHWVAISELDPQNVYAIYSARELYKQQGRFAQAIPLFAREQAVIADTDRKLALYRDEAEVRRNAGDLTGATEPLRQAYRLKADDPAVTYEFGLSVVERIDAGQNVAHDERQEAARALVGLAEMYDGEHGMTYAQAALRAEPAQDRAMQLADYYAEQLGRQGELVEQYQAYLEGNPSGYCAEKARAVLAGMGAPMAGQRHPSSPAIAGGRQPSHQSVPLPSSQPQAYAPQPYAPPQQDYAPPQQEYAPQQPAYAPPVDQTASLLQQANDAVHQGRKPQAYELYRQVLEQEPTHPEALGWVEDFLRQRRKFAELRDVLLAAARAPGVSAETRLAQLRDVATLSETKLRDYDAAVGAWKQIYQIDRGDEQARKQLFALLEKLKRWDELAPLLEQQAMNEDDDEAKIALEKRLAQVHERERRDPASAAEAWVRIAQLSPGDLDPIFAAVDLYEKVEQYPDAATVISEQLPQAQTDDQRAQLHTRLGDLRIKMADPGGAADAYAEAGELLQKDESWDKAAQLYLESHRWADAAHILEKRSRLCDGPDKAKLLAQAADALLSAGDPETALVNLESAAELDPIDDALAARVEELHQHAGRHGDHVAFLLRRADRLDDKQKRVEVRHRAAGIQRGLEDEEGARDTLQMVLADGEDVPALQILLDMAERREDWEEAVTYLKRLVQECKGDDKLAYAMREAQLLADGLNDIDAAVERYQNVLDEMDKDNAYAIGAIADLELRRDNHAAAAAAYEKLLERLGGDEQVDVARRLAQLYEGPLDDVDNAIRVLDIVHKGDPEDFEAIERLKKLCERKEDWPRVVTLLTMLIEVEGDEEEASSMTRQLASIYFDKLDRGDEALGALERFADQGDIPCQESYQELGIRLGWKGLVATKLVAWNESVPGAARADALRQAFSLFLEVERDKDARTVGLELARAREADPEIARDLEAVAVRLRDLDALAVAHDILGRELMGLDRAQEYVRQSETMVQAGSEALDAIHHGELAFSGIEPAAAQELLPRLAALTHAPGHVIDLYERQVDRCKRPHDRVEALARAAQVAAERGAVDRSRDFFNAALSSGVQEDTLSALERAAHDADTAAGGGGKLLRTLAESLAAGGQGSRDGGRTRSALLRRAASIAHRELNDIDASFHWLCDSIIAHVHDDALDELEALGGSVNDYGRVDAALTRSLDEVYDGPLVRKLLRRRANLRRDKLIDKRGAAGDLKRLHDLSPSDQDLTRELSALLTDLGDHRGMIELYEDQILRGREPHVRAELARKVARIWEEEIGDAREAADAWRRVLRMKAGDKEAIGGLERSKSGKLKKPPPVRRPSEPPPFGPPDDTFSPAAFDAPGIPKPAGEVDVWEGSAPFIDSDPEGSESDIGDISIGEHVEIQGDVSDAIPPDVVARPREAEAVTTDDSLLSEAPETDQDASAEEAAAVLEPFEASEAPATVPVVEPEEPEEPAFVDPALIEPEEVEPPQAVEPPPVEQPPGEQLPADQLTAEQQAWQQYYEQQGYPPGQYPDYGQYPQQGYDPQQYPGYDPQQYAQQYPGYDPQQYPQQGYDPQQYQQQYPGYDPQQYQQYYEQQQQQQGGYPPPAQPDQNGGQQQYQQQYQDYYAQYGQQQPAYDPQYQQYYEQYGYPAAPQQGEAPPPEPQPQAQGEESINLDEAGADVEILEEEEEPKKP